MLNEIYEKNMECVKKILTDEDLKKGDELDSDNFLIEQSIDGKPIIRAKYLNSYIYLNSRYDPEREGLLLAEKIINGFKKGTTLILCGIGLGYVLKHLIKSLKEKNNRIIVIEPNHKTFNYLIRYVDCEDFFSKDDIKFFIYNSEEQLKKFLSAQINPSNFDNVHFYCGKTYRKVFTMESSFLYESITNEVLYHNMRQNTIRNFSKFWFENQILNSKHIVAGYNANAFNGLFNGKPVVLVSSGPSLDKNIELLKELKGKAFVVSAYSAIGALATHNVIPDMVVSIDCQQKIFENTSSPLYDVPLLCLTSSLNELLDRHRGKKVFMIITKWFYCNFLSRFDKEFTNYATGQSVANTMLDFLVKTKANPIIIIGQDLALADERIHVTGSTHGDESELIKSWGKRLTVEGIYGKPVKTYEVFYFYLTWFERYIEQHEGINIIDATEGGAKIKGTEVMTFRDAIDKYCSHLPSNIDGTLDKLYANAALFNKDEKKLLIDEFKTNLNEFQSLLPFLTDALKHCHKLEGLYKKSDNPNRKKLLGILSQLESIDRELGKRSANMLMLKTAFDEVQIHLKHMELVDLSEGLRAAEMSRLLYDGLKRIAESAIPLLEIAIKNLDGELEGGLNDGR